MEHASVCVVQEAAQALGMDDAAFQEACWLIGDADGPKSDDRSGKTGC